MPALSIPSSLRVYVLVFGASLWSKTQLHHHKLRLCLLAGAVGAQLPNTDMAGGAGAHQGRMALAPGLQLFMLSGNWPLLLRPGSSSSPALLGCSELAAARSRGESCAGGRGDQRARRRVWAVGGPH